MIGKPVVTDPDTYQLSVGLTPREIEMVRQAVEKQTRERAPKAKKKWEEVVTLEHGRYGAVCKETSEVITLGKIRKISGIRSKIPQIRK